MTDPNPSKAVPRPLSQDLLYALRYYLGNRTVIIILAVAALGFGAYANWGWLVAAGLAPIILAMAPCGVMCALGLCMKGQSKSVSADQSAPDATGTSANTVQSLRLSSSERELASQASDTENKPANSRGHKGCC